MENTNISPVATINKNELKKEQKNEMKKKIELGDEKKQIKSIETDNNSNLI